MTTTSSTILVAGPRWFITLGVLLGATACGGSVTRSGVGVGNAGQSLGLHADGAARTAEVCLLKDALGPQAGGVEKSMTETCVKAQKNDQLWRRAMATLALYGERLSAAASGEEADTAGKLEAAMSGVGGADWSDAEDQAARDAVTQLVGQMGAQSGGGSKIDLNTVVKDAAPPVKTLCNSLMGHFDTQARELAEIRKDVDKKSLSKAIRRCGTFETHNICVADTVVDRMVYAEVFARVVAIENATYDAKDSLLRFCVAHDKLAEAAQNGHVDKKETHAAVVEAVKAVTRSQPQWDAPDSSKAADATKPVAAPTKPVTPAKK